MGTGLLKSISLRELRTGELTVMRGDGGGYLGRTGLWVVTTSERKFEGPGMGLDMSPMHFVREAEWLWLSYVFDDFRVNFNRLLS
jgi:hypothetical protein